MRVRPADKCNWAVIPILLGIGAVLTLSNTQVSAENIVAIKYPNRLANEVSQPIALNNGKHVAADINLFGSLALAEGDQIEKDTYGYDPKPKTTTKSKSKTKAKSHKTTTKSRRPKKTPTPTTATDPSATHSSSPQPENPPVTNDTHSNDPTPTSTVDNPPSNTSSHIPPEQTTSPASSATPSPTASDEFHHEPVPITVSANHTSIPESQHTTSIHSNVTTSPLHVTTTTHSTLTTTVPITTTTTTSTTTTTTSVKSTTRPTTTHRTRHTTTTKPWLPTSIVPITAPKSTAVPSPGTSLPAVVIPNLHPNIPPNSFNVIMRFEKVSYYQVIHNNILAAQLVSFVPAQLGDVLDVDPSLILVLAIRDGTNQGSSSSRRKRGLVTTESTEDAILATIAIPKDKYWDLESIVSQKDSELYTPGSNSFGQYVDPSFPLSTQPPAKNGDDGLGNDGGGNAEADPLTGGDPSVITKPNGDSSSNSHLIGGIVALATVAYVGIAMVVFRRYRNKKLKEQERAEEMQNMISAPYNVSSSTDGWAWHSS